MTIKGALVSIGLLFSTITTSEAMFTRSELDQKVVSFVKSKIKEKPNFIVNVSEIFNEHVKDKGDVHSELLSVDFVEFEGILQQAVILRKYNAASYRYYEGKKIFGNPLNYWVLTAHLLQLNSGGELLVVHARHRGF